MIPTSARRRIVIIKMLIDYSTGQVTPRRRIEKKTPSQSSAEAPSYTTGAVRLNISLLPINNRNNLKGEINKQGKQHMTLRNKDKQTNKQRSNMCRGADTGGSTASLSWYDLPSCLSHLFPPLPVPPPHLRHLLTPSDLIHLPSATSTPTLRCTHATMLH